MSRSNQRMQLAAAANDYPSWGLYTLPLQLMRRTLDRLAPRRVAFITIDTI